MYKIYVKGIVQGVGFRPFVYREAKKKGLKGEVKNTGGGVEIITNKKEEVEEFLKNPPPLAKIDSVKSKRIDRSGYDDFYITESLGEEEEAFLPPDVFVCENCLKELMDKKKQEI